MLRCEVWTLNSLWLKFLFVSSREEVILSCIMIIVKTIVLNMIIWRWFVTRIISWEWGDCVYFVAVDQKMIRIRGQQVSTALNRRVLSANTGRSVKPTANSDKPIESCVVDGEQVYRKSYPKKEFRFLMKSQCEANSQGKGYLQFRSVLILQQTHQTYYPLQTSARLGLDRLA